MKFIKGGTIVSPYGKGKVSSIDDINKQVVCEFKLPHGEVHRESCDFEGYEFGKCVKPTFFPIEDAPDYFKKITKYPVAFYCQFTKTGYISNHIDEATKKAVVQTHFASKTEFESVYSKYDFLALITQEPSEEDI